MLKKSSAREMQRISLAIGSLIFSQRLRLLIYPGFVSFRRLRFGVENGNEKSVSASCFQVLSEKSVESLLWLSSLPRFSLVAGVGCAESSSHDQHRCALIMF